MARESDAPGAVIHPAEGRFSAPANETPGDVLVVEAEDQPTATIVPGRQFRRLFSALEAAGPRSLLG
jgi:hypothetical protein